MTARIPRPREARGTTPRAAAPSVPPAARQAVPDHAPPVRDGHLSPAARVLAAAKAMSEAELERGLRRILQDLPQVWAYHPWTSVRSAKGWPDWTFLRRCDTAGAAMFWELKAEAGQPSQAQRECMALMWAAGLNVAVRRPSDLLSGRMARELAAFAGLAGAP